jgi:putative phage-type endonuclease
MQQTDEWFAARLGCVTASRMSDVIATGRGGQPSVTRENYMYELICERLTGVRQEGFTSAEMRWGTEHESDAKAAYEIETGVIVGDVGFVKHPAIAMSGASPDGLVGDGVLECKAPKTRTHLGYLSAGVMPPEYQPQVAWQCACTGRSWADFVSYDPRMPEHLQLFVMRYVPQHEYIVWLEEQVMAFLRELDARIDQLRKLR